ncbi:MAG: transketolase C-terminal domain-containing protein [Nibricoccus sp.]
MKNAFANEISTLAVDDSRVVVLCADGDVSLFQKLSSGQPNQFVDVSGFPSETIGLAAGLAHSGLRPVCFASAASTALECFRRIKHDLCYHGVPVVIVGADGGLTATVRGETHQALQDIALMRSLPGMRVLSPADTMELRSCLRAALAENGPTYIRIGGRGDSAFFPERPTFAFGVWKQVRQGSRVTLLVAGNILPTVAKAADLLEQTSLCPRVYSCASIKPLDTGALLRYFSRDELVVTIEEHARVGGFGAAVAEWLADNAGRHQARLLRLGVEDSFPDPQPDLNRARASTGLSAQAIANAISSFMEAHR